jgi:hypothetical protein
VLGVRISGKISSKKLKSKFLVLHTHDCFIAFNAQELCSSLCFHDIAMKTLIFLQLHRRLSSLRSYNYCLQCALFCVRVRARAQTISAARCLGAHRCSSIMIWRFLSSVTGTRPVSLIPFTERCSVLACHSTTHKYPPDGCLCVVASCGRYFCLGYRVLMAASMKMAVFCANRPNVGGSKHLWNVGKILPDYTALQFRRQQSSYSPMWEPEIQPTSFYAERILLHVTTENVTEL